MKNRFATCIAAFIVFAAMAVPVPLAAQDHQDNNHHKRVRYTITDLGTLGGGFSEGVGVNNRGSVSGNSTLLGDTVEHGFFWRKGVMTDLGTLGGPNSFAPEEWSPNDRDEVAGFSDTSTLDPNGENFCSLLAFYTSPYICRAFIWRHGVMTPLPTLGGNNSAAIAINNRGQVSGIAETTIADPTCFPPQLFDFKAVIWGPKKGEIKELPPLPADNESVALGINDNGQAIGTSATCANGPIEAVLWQNGTPINLGSLGGTVFNIAFGINNRGQVVGQSNLPGDTTHHAFFWQNGAMTDLGTILGLPNSLATSINNRGQVVGFSQVSGFSTTVAWIWQDGVMTDLNTLIPADSPWFIVEALGINDRGQISGYMLNTSTGEVPGFVLTPVEGSEESMPAAQSSAGRRSTVVLPENVRQMLERRVGLLQRWPGHAAPRN